MLDSLDPGLLAECLAMTIGGGLFVYLVPSALLNWAYHKRRRDRAAEWKHQPDRWSPAKRRREEIRRGTAMMTMASVASGLFVYYVRTGGATALYFDFEEYGVLYTLVSTAVYFVVVDMGLYWAHRLFHRKFLYRTIHHIHHRWVTPTAFTAAAMHPIEMITFQAISFAPIFFFPMHPAGVVGVLLYQHFVSLIDHSGIRLHSRLPWQAPAAFHDDHHIYFHVNFSQNMALWDRLFGTWRRHEERYGEGRFVEDQGVRAPLMDYGRDAVAARSAARLERRRKRHVAPSAGAPAVSGD